MANLQLTPEQFQRVARAISDANRWEILQKIFKEPEVTCGSVAELLPITAGTISHHLRELEMAELINVTKCGRFRKLTPNRVLWRAYLAQLRKL